jgi:hypothetical protein
MHGRPRTTSGWFDGGTQAEGEELWRICVRYRGGRGEVTRPKTNHPVYACAQAQLLSLRPVGAVCVLSIFLTWNRAAPSVCLVSCLVSAGVEVSERHA